MDPFCRGRVIGGVAAAFKTGRLDAAWGRRMLSRRGVTARLTQIAVAGYQRRGYFSELGRAGGIASGVARRRRASERRLVLADPIRAAHARLVLALQTRTGRSADPRAWMS
jgi:hypothetical protein